ncbi:MAG: TetR/AcrR family transcriptional regulator [Polyangiaceae bacterium]
MSEPNTDKGIAGTRRTGGVQVQGRAAQVVERVLASTCEEFARVGYAELRVDEIAARSGVNKTTIYRRWPTKGELVSAALKTVKRAPPSPETGNLEEELLAWFKATMAFADSPLGGGIVRVIQQERSHPELAEIARELRQEHLEARRAIVQRAVKRGELPASTDVKIVTDLVFIPVMARFMNFGERTRPADFLKAVRVVIAGVRALGTPT